MNRLQEKYELFAKLGMLFGPLQKIVEHPEQYNEQEKSETVARYMFEFPKVYSAFDVFSKGQAGCSYAVEFQKFSHALHQVQAGLSHDHPFEKVITENVAKAKAAIEAVPVPQTSVILEAGSPFTAYCRLRELCEADATKNLIWLDPYLASNVFNRYAANVRELVPVTLVTSEPGSSASKRDKQRWTDFLDVSRLFAAERGPQLYRLIVNQNLHDRWAVFDDKRIYSLGGSSKDAADRDYFTIAAVEGTPANLKSIQDHIDNGTEYFGPNVTIHK